MISISFKTFSNNWNFVWYSFIVAVAMPQKFRCSLEWPLRAKKHTHIIISLYSGKSNVIGGV